MKVLIVDESKDFGELLLKKYKDQIELTTAHAAETLEYLGDYAEAEQLLRIESLFDVVIIDPTPANGDAAATALRILENLKGTPTITIALSSLEDVKNCVDCMLAGVANYIPKSRSNEVVDAVQATISRETQKRTQQSDKDAEFVERNFEELRRKYGGRWIAVAGGKFAGEAKTYGEIKEKVAGLPPIGTPKLWLIPPSFDEEET